MEIVIDASCIMAVLMNEPEKADVILKTKGCSLIAPACLPFEICNALSSLMKRDLITVSEAAFAYHQFSRIQIRFIEPDLQLSLVIAGENKIYAYDAYYMSIAEQYGFSVYSLDKKFNEVASGRMIKCL